MTDAEAKYDIEGWLSLEAAPECETCISIKALRHALQAIADRAAMVAGDDAWAYLPAQEAVSAARRHMRGEP